MPQQQPHATAFDRAPSATRPERERLLRSRLLVTVGVAAVVMSGALASPAHAATSPSDPLSAIEAAAPEVLDGVAAAPVTASGELAITHDLGIAEVAVEVPVDPADGITLDGPDGVSLGIDLPNAILADSAVAEADGIVSYDNRDGSTTVPVVKNDGSVQITTVIDGPEAPTSYAYPLDVPAGASVVLDEVSGGAAVIGADGAWLAGVDPAWAKDATGAPVPTHYELSGTTLTQVVEHSAEFAYPVVADPRTSLLWWGTATKLTRSETKSLSARIGSSPPTAVAAFCAFVPTTVAKVACSIAVAWRIPAWITPIKDAARQGRCAQINIPYGSGPALWNVTNERC